MVAGQSIFDEPSEQRRAFSASIPLLRGRMSCSRDRPVLHYVLFAVSNRRITPDGPTRSLSRRECNGFFVALAPGPGYTGHHPSAVKSLQLTRTCPVRSMELCRSFLTYRKVAIASIVRVGFSKRDRYDETNLRQG
jgi:hypothetical protein